MLGSARNFSTHLDLYNSKKKQQDPTLFFNKQIKAIHTIPLSINSTAKTKAEYFLYLEQKSTTIADELRYDSVKYTARTVYR